jgi:hypothetical protein
MAMRIPFDSLVQACKVAGARDPHFVASVIHIRASRLGTDEALQTAKTKRPDWFWPDSLVVDAERPRETSGKGRRRRDTRRAAQQEWS